MIIIEKRSGLQGSADRAADDILAASSQRKADTVRASCMWEFPKIGDPNMAP